MSKVSNVAFGASALFFAAMFGFGALLGIVMGISFISNGLTTQGVIALGVGALCLWSGYRRIKQVIVAAKNVNARQAAQAAANNQDRPTPEA